jgi:S1-C subfamily serine protease
MLPINEDLVIDAVQKSSRSVVNIASVRTAHDELFRMFPVEGVGSGVIIDEKCHVLTNNHVLDLWCLAHWKISPTRRPRL